MSKMLKVVGASWLQTKVSSYILGILGVLAILALFVGQIERIQEDGNYAATVFYSEKTGYRIEFLGQSNELADIPKGVARGYFRHDIDTDGWSMLEIETDPSYSDENQAYAAGIIEGALTWSLIHNHLKNTIEAKCEGIEKQCEKLRDHLDKSVNKWKVYAAERADEEPFWHQVSLYYIQISGVYTGWKHGVERKEEEFEGDISDLFWLNYYAEVAEIQHKLNISIDNPNLDVLPGLSSAFTRIVNDSSSDYKPKIFVAHNAAGSYSSMTRILKRYILNYHKTSEDKEPSPGTTIDFSSYPGSITSQDEFYLIQGKNHKLAVTGTAVRNFNKELWKDVNITEQVPMGPRISAANHMATNVSSWGHLMASSNSGTACKQWMVIDLNKFDKHNFTSINENKVVTPKKEIITETSVEHGVRHTHVMHSGHAKGIIWLIEQIPARTHSADFSDVLLEEGYLATYGIPIFKDISDASHINKMEELYGSVYSEVESPRSVMFKEGFKNATTLNGVLRLMRHNNMTENNMEHVQCTNTIECLVGPGGYLSVLGVRGDIVEHHKEAYGVIDTKIIIGTSQESALEFVAVSGPTYTDSKKNVSAIPLNKGIVASIYTDKFDDASTINGLEIRDHVKHQIEEAKQESIERFNANFIKPFQWSKSEYKDYSHEGLPDKWAFAPFTPRWSW